jgi:hypothetical protein
VNACVKQDDFLAGDHAAAQAKEWGGTFRRRPNLSTSA